MRERFLRDGLPVPLGNVASDLARLSDWACEGHTSQALVDLMREIAHEMEWSGEAGLAELADMQREVCFWRRAWPADPARPVLARRARAMSDWLLELSGLLGDAAGRVAKSRWLCDTAPRLRACGHARP
jgi:hypothetical protein